MKFIDLTDRRFGRLIAKECVGKDKAGHKLWLCECDCGNKKIISGTCLLTENTRSCGCYNREILKGRDLIKMGFTNKKHGLSDTRIYRIYATMKDRCYNCNRDKYSIYGGRGITVCNEWLNSFEAFYEWAINNGYQEDLSIDRKDVNGNYEPDNCRWANASTQGFNRNLQSNNTTGHKGISMSKNGRYRTYIKKNNKQIWLGTYDTVDDAIKARNEAENEYYGEIL